MLLGHYMMAPERTAIHSNVWYATRDERRGELVIRYFFRRNKSHMTVYIFGDGTQFIGLNNKLWQLDSFSNHYYTTRPGWFYNWEGTRKIVKLEWFNPYLYDPAECRLLCKIHDGDEQDRNVICIGLLYDVTHALIRLQRWTRRVVVGRARRLAVLMCLHARLGEMSGLAVLGADLVAGLILVGRV